MAIIYDGEGSALRDDEIRHHELSALYEERLPLCCVSSVFRGPSRWCRMCAEPPELKRTHRIEWTSGIRSTSRRPPPQLRNLSTFSHVNTDPIAVKSRAASAPIISPQAMSFGRPGGFGDAFKVSPPQRGSFPLDHDGMFRPLHPSPVDELPASYRDDLTTQADECFGIRRVQRSDDGPLEMPQGEPIE